MRIYSLFTLVLTSVLSYAQPNIRFVAYNSDTDENFAFVNLSPIKKGQEIYFTDKNWNCQNSSFPVTSEGLLLWQTDSVIPAGAVVTITSKAQTNIGTATVLDAGYNLSNSNDILYAYIKDSLYGIKFLTVLSTSSIPDSVLFNTNISSNLIAEFDNDNGAFSNYRNITISLTDNFYDQSNWEFTDGTGDQSVPIDTSSFTIKAEATIIKASYNIDGVTVELKQSVAISKTVLCFDTLPIRSQDIARLFANPDSINSILVPFTTKQFLFDSLQSGKTYYFKAASFSPANNAIFLSEEHHIKTPKQTTEYCNSYPSSWTGDTSYFSLSQNGLTLQTDSLSGTIFLHRNKADQLIVKTAPWNYDLSNQNNWGIILSSDREFHNHPNSDYWNGYFLRFGIDGTNNGVIYKRNGITNTELATVTDYSIDQALSFYISYNGNGSISIEILSESNFSLLDHTIEDVDVEKYFCGSFIKRNKPNNVFTFTSFTQRKYENEYTFTQGFSISNPDNWTPQRNLAFESDVLQFDNHDSIVCSSSFLNASQIHLNNSNLYLVNTDTLQENTLSISDSFTIDSTSRLYITNSESSTKPCILTLDESAQMTVNGTVVFDAQGQIPDHIIIGNSENQVTINGAVIITKQDGYPFQTTGNFSPFHFTSGSSFIQYDGKHPFGNNTFPAVVFQSGSSYQYYDGGLSFAGKDYSTLELHNPLVVKFLMGSADTSSIESLIIHEGSYIFSLQANNLPSNIFIDDLLIKRDAKLSIDPVNAEATSSLIINKNNALLNGNGELYIGKYGQLEVLGSNTSLRINTNIEGALVFGGESLLHTDSCELFISGKINNYSTESYIVQPFSLADSTSYLVRPVNDEASECIFPVGTIDGFSPMVISNNTGEASDFKVRTFNGMYTNGLYGNEYSVSNILNQTWEITPDKLANVDVQISWEEPAEREDFFRDYAQLIINHHRENDDNWNVIDNSQYSYTNGMHNVTGFDISDFSTVSAQGSGSPLAIYFTDFKVEDHKNRTVVWLQTIPTDSTQLWGSPDGIQFFKLRTVQTENLEQYLISLKDKDPELRYIKMKQFKAGKMVEQSRTIIIKNDNQNSNIDVIQHASEIIISNPQSEEMNLLWTNTLGKTVRHKTTNAVESIETLPLHCTPCIFTIQSNSVFESYIFTNPE